MRVGSLVRVELHGRRVRAWVIADGVEPPTGIELRPIAKVTGWGPSAEVVELAHWAAWRWAGRPAQLLGTASPPTAVRGLPDRPAQAVRGSGPEGVARDALSQPRSVVRIAPAADRYPLLRAAAGLGEILVLTPSLASATQLTERLGRDGFPVALLPRGWAAAAAGGRVVVGTRAAAWAPSPSLRAVFDTSA